MAAQFTSLRLMYGHMWAHQISTAFAWALDLANAVNGTDEAAALVSAGAAKAIAQHH
jgi:hypothetical protein